MPSGLAEWVGTLTCRQCLKMVDFDQVSVPAQRLREWATCCGEIMESEMRAAGCGRCVTSWS